MDHLTPMLVGGYKPGAPSLEAETMDAEIAESRPCPSCGGQMRYQGYHRHYDGYTEYVALALCTCCGRKISF